jgi:hypothetical protein
LSSKRGKKPSSGDDEKSKKSTKGRQSDPPKQPKKKQRTTTPPSKKGSEDAYMLIYVKKDFLAKHAMESASSSRVVGLNDELFKGLDAANAQFASDCQRYVDSKAEKQLLVEKRKESVKIVFPLLGETELPSPDEEFRFVNTSWLRNWIAGLPLIPESCKTGSRAAPQGADSLDHEGNNNSTCGKEAVLRNLSFGCKQHGGRWNNDEIVVSFLIARPVKC